MKTIRNILKRNVYGAAALLMLATVAVPNLFVSQVSAAQLTARSIKMSSAEPSATGVGYEVQFTTAAAMQSLVIDFCSNSPLIGQTCTAPAGMNVGSAATATAGWSVGTGSASQIRLTNTTSQGAGTFTITVTGLTNPSLTVPGTFYARIYTFANATYGTYTNATTIGNAVDNGSVAMSTSDDVDISAAVLETLTFCVTNATAPTAGCANAGGANSPNLILGTGSPAALSASNVDTANAHFQLSTNASGNTSVRLAGNTLTSGSNDINAAGGSAVAIAAGTERFGLKLTDVAGGTGTVTREVPYDNATNYAFDTTATTATYGDVIAQATGPVADKNVQLNFAATISPATPAGLYTTALSLIATSSY